MKRISFIAISGILIFSASSALAYEFTGPTTQPTSGNTPGVIWNVDGTTVTQPTAKINIGGTATVGGGASISNNINLQDTKAFRIDKAGASTFNIGNWGNGQQPFTFGVYGDIKMYSFGGLAGQKGRMDAMEYCINGASCITAWPSGGGGGVTTIAVGSGLTVTNPTGPTATIGLSSSCAANQVLKWNGSSWVCSADNNSGGTLTGITAGTGATISGAAPSPTINVTDLYVNTTGDTMTGNLIFNSGFIQLNNGGLFSYNSQVFSTTTNQTAVSGISNTGRGASGYSSGGVGVHGQSVVNYGVYGTSQSGGGVRGQITTGAGNGVEGESTSGIGVWGLSTNGYGLYGWSTNSYGAYVVNGIFSNGKIDIFNGDVTINNSKNLCLGGVCRNTWPVGGTGDITGVTAGSGLTGGATAGDATVNVGAGTGIQVNTDDVQIVRSYQLPQTCSHGQTATRNAQIVAGVQQNFWECNSMPTGDVTAVYAGNGLTGGSSSGDATVNVGAGSNISVAADSISVAPSGAWGSIQFNNSGSLGASNSLYWDNANSRLGIGTQVPIYPLDVSGSLNLNKGIASGGAALRVNASEAIWFDGTYFSWGYGATYNFFADPVYFGSTYVAPTYRITLPNSTTNLAGRGLANLWATYSDTRVKFNQKPLEYGLKELLALKPKSYEQHSSTFNNGKLEVLDDSEKAIGFIAQEVYDVIPEAVSKPKDESTELWTMSYEKLTPAIVKAIQEQQDQIESLKKQNETLEEKIDKLEAKVDALMK